MKGINNFLHIILKASNNEKLCDVIWRLQFSVGEQKVCRYILIQRTVDCDAFTCRSF